VTALLSRSRRPAIPLLATTEPEPGYFWRNLIQVPNRRMAQLDKPRQEQPRNSGSGFAGTSAAEAENLRRPGIEAMD
jgi:hypothetical protein